MSISTGSSQHTALWVSLGQEQCAIPVEEIQEVVPMAALSRPPGMSRLLEGFLNLRGAAIPVLRLDRICGFPEQTPALYSCLVILKGPEDRRFAFLADRAHQVVSVSASDLAPLEPGNVFNEISSGDVRIAGHVLHLLSPKRILLAQEWSRLAEFEAIEQRRLSHWEEAT